MALAELALTLLWLLLCHCGEHELPYIYGANGNKITCPPQHVQECDTHEHEMCTMNDGYTSGMCIVDWEDETCCLACQDDAGFYCKDPKFPLCLDGYCTPCNGEEQKGCGHLLEHPICNLDGVCVSCGLSEHDFQCLGTLQHEDRFMCNGGKCVECFVHHVQMCAASELAYKRGYRQQITDNVHWRCNKDGKCSECFTDEECMRLKEELEPSGGIWATSQLVCDVPHGECVECYTYAKTGDFNKGCNEGRICKHNQCRECREDHECDTTRDSVGSRTCEGGFCKERDSALTRINDHTLLLLISVTHVSNSVLNY